MLTFAGDDGGAKGQAYRFCVDQETGTATLRFRFPDEQGRWCWRKTPAVIKLPEIVKQRLKEDSQLAPTLREHVHPDGSRIAVLDFVVSVSKASLPPFEQIERVLYELRKQTLAHLAANVLLLPPTGPRTRPTSSGKVYYPGWTRSAFLQSSSPKEISLRLCG